MRTFCRFAALPAVLISAGTGLASGTPDKPPVNGARPSTPWPTKDWQTRAPASQGIDADALERLRAHIISRLPHVRSMVVVRHGWLVFEHYRNGLDRDDRHELASVTKSITSLLVGVAQQDGLLTDIQQPLGRLLPHELAPGNDPRWKQVTLRHLLAMTSGLEWSEGPPTRGDVAAQALRLPFAHQPGEVFNYNTPASHLLSAVLTRAMGRNAEAFAVDRLFVPLGITDLHWPADTRGHTFAGFGLSLRSRDLAKIGLLCLRDGRWENRQILPPGWINESAARASSGGPPEQEPYGYLWWVADLAGEPSFFAAGFGGQFLYLVPGQDLVVVITSNLDRPHPENRALISQFVMPALHAP